MTERTRTVELVQNDPLWCADFDADLPKVVPQAMEILGDLADLELRTYATETNGRINCPCAWHTEHGLTAFFSTPGWGGPAPPGYMTDKPLIDCTFAEVVRDEWIHDSAVVVNGRLVWKPPSELMMRLMFDLRGWKVLSDEERAETRGYVRASLAAAVQRLEEVVS